MGEGLIVLSLVEVDIKGRLSTDTLECLAMGRKLAAAGSGRLDALIVGGGEARRAAEEIRHCGVDTTYIMEDAALEPYQADLHSSAVQRVLERLEIDLLLMANTVTILDVAPRVAFRMDLPLLTDCVDIRLEGGELLLTKPIYSGNVTAVYSPASLPCMATLRKSSIEPVERVAQPTGEIVALDVGIDANIARTEVVESGVEGEEGKGVDKVAVVVAGGRGLGGPEGFEQLQDVAELLDGAVGASRPPCDLGWINCSAQVGQTGAIIAPSLYIAVGISGSMQHISGMSRSKVVVAINKDPKASIFASADYGAVGDFEEILPAFKRSLQGILG